MKSKVRLALNAKLNTAAMILLLCMGIFGCGPSPDSSKGAGEIQHTPLDACLSSAVSLEEFRGWVKAARHDSWQDAAMEAESPLLVHESEAAYVAQKTMQKLLERVGVKKARSCLNSGVFMKAFMEVYDRGSKFEGMCSKKGGN